jgi:hypothetical protein
VILHDAATAFITLIDTALMWARLAGAALAFVLCVIAFAIGPLIAPHARRGARRGSRAPHSLSIDSNTTEDAPKPPQRRTARPAPSWAHTEPYTYEEAA